MVNQTNKRECFVKSDILLHQLIQLSHHQSEEQHFFPNPVYDVKVLGGYVYLANGAGGMKILNASNPLFGVHLSVVGTGFASAYPATCVDVLDKYAYVGSKDPTLDDSKLEVVSLGNKAAPFLSGSIVPAP